MNITKGKIKLPQRVVIYGPEGIGKSTFASKFPQPLFIDTEGSTNQLDVSRLDSPSSWTMFLEEVKWVIKNPNSCKTLVIDTMDWAERMCVQHVCVTHNKKGIEDFGYGNGYVYVSEEIGKFLNLLNEVIKVGINVLLTAHAQIKKVEQPEEFGGYDHWELKLGKKTSSQTSPLVKEWADMLLFANYKVVSVAVDDKGQKRKGTGGKRVMYTTHHVCWDAKNRHNLPEELEFSFSEIAHVFEDNIATFAPAEISRVEDTKDINVIKKAEKVLYFQDLKTKVAFEVEIGEDIPTNDVKEISAEEFGILYKEQIEKINDLIFKDPGLTPTEKSSYSDMAITIKEKNKRMTWEQAFNEAKKQAELMGKNPSPPQPKRSPPVIKHKALNDLMKKNDVEEYEIRKVVSYKGYYPKDTPIDRYDPGFIDGVLVGAWEDVYKLIENFRRA